MYVNDLEAAKDFFIKYLGGRSNDGYHNDRTGFRSYFISFDDGARLEIMNNPDWPLDNINRFWFVQVQALTKLYRRDYLISAHLANMNLNDTLVMQMIMRDKKYSTNHHRYGYSKQLEYIQDMGKMPYNAPDATFGRIADQLYAAALTYDRLVKYFYPQYQERAGEFKSIWNEYDSCR